MENKYSLRARRGALPTDVTTSGAISLMSWISNRSKDFETVAQKRDIDGSMIDRALEIVRKFIIDRKLILFGGLAIDYALRIKGDRIYPDEQRPDFDFFSTRNVDDAYDLADIFYKAGFEEVGAIRAIHAQTMKVRTDFIWVADIGYAPPDVFDKIPTFDYQGMRVVHPDFQRMDMHLALCFPFNGAPREDVFNRWSKDLKRFNLVEKYYPIIVKELVGSNIVTKVTGRFPIPVTSINGSELKMALCGFAAYAAIRNALDELASAFKVVLPVLNAPHLELTFPDDNTVIIENPLGNSIIVASPWPEEVIAGIADIKKLSPYMDVFPDSYSSSSAGITVMSTKGRKLAASLVRISHESKKQVYVVTPQYLLMWLLFEAQRTTDENNKNIYHTYYVHTLEILNVAEIIYADKINADASSEELLMASFATSPFAPTLLTIGDVNLDASYIIRMAGNAAKLKDIPPKILNLEEDVANILIGLPTSYFPATSKKRPIFSYDENLLFRRSGLASPQVI